MSISKAPDRKYGPKRRIKHRQEFLRIQSEGAKEHSRNFLLIHSPIEDSPRATGESRLGITVTRKVDKRAVGRNQIQRYVREAFRHLQQNLSVKRDIVFIAKQGAVNSSYSDVMSEVAYLLRRAKLLPVKQKHSKRAKK